MNEKTKAMFLLARRGLKLVTMVGTGLIIGGVCGFGVLAVPTILLPLKACAMISADILTGMISDYTDEYIDAQMNEIEDTIEKTIEEVQKAREG